MSSRRPSFNTTFSIHDFETKLQELTILPKNVKEEWEGKSFIRGGTLTVWLESSAVPDHPASRVELLLDHVFPDRERPIPISGKEVLKGDKKCPLMFSILLELDHGHLIHDFHKFGIHDACLPMSLHDLSRHLEDALPRFSKTAKENLALKFYKKQWTYFPLMFSHGVRPLPLDQDKRLPICQRSKIGRGGTADIYMIAVPEDFVDAKLRAAVPFAAFNHAEHGNCYQFALKSFADQSHNMFEAEIQAYHFLQDQKHVIKCFGGFSHFADDDDQSREHSILLEYGECDLSAYFSLVNPPALREDVNSFWVKLFNVVKAVTNIHSFTAARGGRMEAYDGWHGDIKPENILLIEKQLKLADPGFVNFIRSIDGQDANGIPHLLNGWTSTYGPPEVNEANSAVLEPWAVDIWSIGCVLSEAATWVVLGQKGRVAYTAARQQAVRDQCTAQNKPDPMNYDLGNGDFFHNGKTVLPDIKKWHEMLKTMVRPNDNVTKQVIDLVDNKLLLREPSRRMRAEKICSEFANIHDNAQRGRLQDTAPLHFHDLIHKAAKQDLQSWISGSQILEGLSMEERKAHTPSTFAILEAMKPSQINLISAANPMQSCNSERGDTTNFSHTYTTWSSAHQTTPIRTLNSNESSIVTSGITKTVFDAYYERMTAEKGRLDRITKKSKKAKDRLLSLYYKQRDIIFLVDNGGNMAPVWQEVRFTLTELVGKARNQDEDGLDLMFTRSNKTVKNAKQDAIDLFKAAIEHEDVQPCPGVNTNMSQTLDQLLSTWLRSFRRSPDSTRKLTLIVLTNGKWYSTVENDVDSTIIGFSKDARNLDGFVPRTRPVSIQFVSFGQDPMALARLQRLDDRLRYYDIEDIVDTEPSSGNIYKMLLGSFNPDIDEQNTPDEANTSSPPRNYSSSSAVHSPSPLRSSTSHTSSWKSSPRATESNAQNIATPSSPTQRPQRPESSRVPRTYTHRMS